MHYLTSSSKSPYNKNISISDLQRGKWGSERFPHLFALTQLWTWQSRDLNSVLTPNPMTSPPSQNFLTHVSRSPRQEATGPHVRIPCINQAVPFISILYLRLIGKHGTRPHSLLQTVPKCPLWDSHWGNREKRELWGLRMTVLQSSLGNRPNTYEIIASCLGSKLSTADSQHSYSGKRMIPMETRMEEKGFKGKCLFKNGLDLRSRNVEIKLSPWLC